MVSSSLKKQRGNRYPLHKKGAGNLKGLTLKLSALHLCVWLLDNCYDSIFSCLHFGQYKGKLNNSVSSLILVRVLPLHIGHNTHDCFSTAPPPFILTEHKIHINAIKFSRKHIAQLSVSYSPLTNRKLIFQYSPKNLTHHVLYVQPQI
jgi:hypothetical protein